MSSAILRALFAVLFAVTGFLLGREAFVHLIALHVSNPAWLLGLRIAVPVLGAVAGVFFAPLAQVIFEVELGEMEAALGRLTLPELMGGAVGLAVGLLIAWLVKSVLFEFMEMAGKSAGYVGLLVAVLLSVFAAYLGVRVGSKQRIGSAARGGGSVKLLDTSVVIDGRIVEIVRSGFLESPFVLPRFVLRELQMVADSADPHKRMRGRRGLEVLAKLQEATPLEIEERDYDAGGVDDKLVRLARERGAKLLTNDFNLGRVAHVEGVPVLNINELAGAVKTVFLPGEELHVALIRDGKEPGQGVGYLDDGTMIVVENARRSIGEDVDVQVTSVLQTVAGRMVFAKLKRASGGSG